MTDKQIICLTSALSNIGDTIICAGLFIAIALSNGLMRSTLVVILVLVIIASDHRTKLHTKQDEE